MLFKQKFFFEKKLKQYFDQLNRRAKVVTAILIDSFCFIFSVWLSLSLFSNELHVINYLFFHILFIMCLVAIPVFWMSRLYSHIFRYFSLDGLYELFKAVFIYSIIILIIILFSDKKLFTLSFFIMHSLLFIIMGSSVRILFNNFYSNYTSIANLRTVMVYGAGTAGRQIAAALKFNNLFSVIGFFDDDSKLQGLRIAGWKIYNPKRIKKIVIDKGITDIIIAIPSLSNLERQIILKSIEKIDVNVKTLPNLNKIISGEMSVTDLLEINITDLLSRDMIDPIDNLLKMAVSSKVVVVTGAGGSIGSEVCRQLLNCNPRKLILVDISEASLYKIDYELKYLLENKKNIQIISIIGSVCDYDRMSDVFNSFKPDTIYHAAAYKHVTLVESNCMEGVNNNIFGTINIANVAKEHNVKKFIFVSTDKAVRPTNIMGATKRVSEMYLQAINKKLNNIERSNTKFSIVRFGNVLGSSGSVIPLFKKQIELGGPITLTHKDVERYFMTIPEAAQLVIQSSNIAKGGEVFVLGMGNRIKIYDLAIKMINLLGLRVKDKDNPNGDISIEYIGLRPGEKMYEELLINNNSKPTIHPKIIEGKEDFMNFDMLEKEIKILKNHIINNDITSIINHLEHIVLGYNASKNIVDISFVAKKNK